MKRLISTIIIAVLVFSLFGCNKQKDEYSGSITISLPYADGNKTVFEDAILKYKELRPNANITISWQSGDDFYSTYLDSISKKNAPDCTYIDHIYIQTLASRNKIIPITDDVNDIQSSYIDNLLEIGKMNDDYYAYPFSANTICLFYNKDILGDRDVPTTYSEFLEVGKQIKLQESTKSQDNRAKVFCLYTGYDSKSFGSFIFNSWLKREGGQILSDDLKTCRMDSGAAKKVLEKWKEIANEGLADPDLSAENLFYSGKVAFIEMGCWKIPNLIGENSTGNYGVAPLFSLEDNGGTNSVLGLYSLCVTKQEDETKMKIASDFCKFLSSNTDVQFNYAKNKNLLPVTKDACAKEYYQTPEWQVFINSMSDAATRPGSPVWPNIQTEIEGMIVNSMSGRIDISTSIDAVQRRIQNMLSSYYK